MPQVDVQQILQMIHQGQNPQQIIISYLSNQLGNSPLGANLINLVQKRDAAGIEKVVRNMLASQGRDYDKEFNAFKQQFGLK